MEFKELIKMEDVILRITKNMNLSIIDCSKTDYWGDNGTGCKEDYINKSYIVGKEIILGIYDNPEFRIISFFHELGHLASNKVLSETEYEVERIAWEIGFMIAASHGIFFSEEAEDWANEQLESYKDERELVDTL